MDEVHELKGATEQGQVLAWIRDLVPRLLVGTGSLSSGYADDLHYLPWRLSPRAMAAGRLPHDAPDTTLQHYGRLERIERSRRDGSDGVLGKKATASVRTKRLPGISPPSNSITAVKRDPGIPSVGCADTPRTRRRRHSPPTTPAGLDRRLYGRRTCPTRGTRWDKARPAHGPRMAESAGHPAETGRGRSSAST